MTTRELAARDRVRQGNLETEFCYGDEADNRQAKEECVKNPGHLEFKDVPTFTKALLPRGFQMRELMRAIKTSADLVVLITVCFTSRNRPDDDLLADNRGRSLPLRKGSGWLWKVEQRGGRRDSIASCPCRTCQHSEDPSQTWWELIFITAAHVVFDESECKKTNVLFYSDSDGDNSRSVELKGHCMGDSNDSADRGMFTCVTHDAVLCKELIKLCKRRTELIEKCNDSFHRNDYEGLSVVISHPHGLKKLISIGKGINRDDEELATYYTHSAPTCTGSSGGFTWAVGWGSHHSSVAPHKGKDDSVSDTAADQNINRSGWSWPL